MIGFIYRGKIIPCGEHKVYADLHKTTIKELFRRGYVRFNIFRDEHIAIESSKKVSDENKMVLQRLFRENRIFTAVISVKNKVNEVKSFDRVKYYQIKEFLS